MTRNQQSITTPLALSCTRSATITSPWFVQATEYNPATATYLPLVNGKDTFAAVFDAISGAKHSIDILCWGFQPSMYFKRGSGGLGSPCIGDLLEMKGLEKPGVKIRLLVWSDSLHVASFSEDMMPGNHGIIGLAAAAKDGRSNAQRKFDLLWYSRANRNNVTRSSLTETGNPLWQARTVGTFLADSLPGAPKPLKNIEFATRDFGLVERAEIAWRSWMSASAGNPKLATMSTASLTAEPSHHQKMVLVDYEAPEQAVGFVMGQNTLDEYWDTSDHTYLRQPPQMGRNGLHPRQDMSAIVTGPILEYLNENFCQAWDDATGQNLSSARAALHCRLQLRRDLNPAKYGKPLMAQILRTQSQHGKGGTKDIETLYMQAVNNATNFVYIENQYFRYQPLADKLRKNINAQTRGGRNPAEHGEVYLFVVTNSNDEGIGLGTVSTYQMLDALGYGDRMPGIEKLEKNEALRKQERVLTEQLATEQASDQRLVTQGADFARMQGIANYLQDSRFREIEIQQKIDQVRQEQQRVAGLRADGMKNDDELTPPQDMPGLKVLICTLVAPDTPAGQPWDYVYVHQKLMIVDDIFTTHGSANVNRRSMEFDSELNICHEDGEATAKLRRQMWGMHTNRRGAQDDMADAYGEWSKIISRNTLLQNQKQAPIASLVGFLRTSPKRSYED